VSGRWSTRAAPYTVLFHARQVGQQEGFHDAAREAGGAREEHDSAQAHLERGRATSGRGEKDRPQADYQAGEAAARGAVTVEEKQRSPRVTHFAWGRIQLEGRQAGFKDVKLYPGGSRAWDWRETGTEHVPGIQPADVEELLQHGATIVVLSRGVFGRLRITPDTLRLLQDRGITVHVLRTAAAVRLYNQLAVGAPVGALLHSTC
jgi:hypothetical protein